MIDRHGLLRFSAGTASLIALIVGAALFTTLDTRPAEAQFGGFNRGFRDAPRVTAPRMMAPPRMGGIQRMPGMGRGQMGDGGMRGGMTRGGMSRGEAMRDPGMRGPRADDRNRRRRHPRTARRRQGPQRLQGRRPKIDPVEVRRLHEEERLSPTAIARRLGIARSSVYRFLPRCSVPASGGSDLG